MTVDDDVKQENRDNLRRLKEQVCGVGVVPFVGAGFSVPMGYPGWTQFLLAEAVRANALAEVQRLLDYGKYEFAADLLLERRGARAFEDAIYNAYDDKSIARRQFQG